MGVRSRFKKVLSVAMALTIIVSFFGTSALAAPDTRGHWAEKEINEWVEQGLIGGYKDGSFKPDASISRAEFIALVNRAFAFTESSESGFNDVSQNDWYYNEVLRAKAAGYIGGYQDGTIKPKNNINRQEVAAILSRLLNVGTDATGVNQFKDKDAIPQWSAGIIGGIVNKGLMNGYSDGTFNPLKNTTRAEAVVILKRALEGKVESNIEEKKNVYNNAGTYGPEEGTETIKGNVEVTASGVTLKNMVIEGNLTIAKEVGNGEVFLKGVTVKGKTYVNGGGENSIHFEDTVLLTVIVNKADGTVRIVASGKTTVQEVTLQSSAKLEQIGAASAAFKAVTLSEALPKDSKVTLIGEFESVEILAVNIAVEVPRGVINNLKVAEGAIGAIINLSKDAKIVSLIVDAIAKFLGTGVIEKAEGKHANASSYEKMPNSGVGPTTYRSTGGGGGGGGSTDGGGDSSTPTDKTAPTIKSLSPANGAKNVSILKDLVITFSEDVVAVDNKNIVINPIEEEWAVDAIKIPVKSDYVKVAGSVVTIKLWNYLKDNNGDDIEVALAGSEFEVMATSLDEEDEDESDDWDSEVYVTIDKGAFKDKAGNEFAGINDKTTWSFSFSYDPLTTIEVTTAFEDGEGIPEKYSLDGGNVSLPVSWTKVDDAKSYMILFTDNDADNFVHWIVKDIPANVTSIEEGLSGKAGMVGIEMKNDFPEPPDYNKNMTGYGGPQPPIQHVYTLGVLALNIEKFDLSDNATPRESFEAIQEAYNDGIVIGMGWIYGTFGPEVDRTASTVSLTSPDTISIDSKQFTFNIEVKDTTGQPISGLWYFPGFIYNDFRFWDDAENGYINIVSVIESIGTPGLYTVTATYEAEEYDDEVVEIIVYVADVELESTTTINVSSSP